MNVDNLVSGFSAFSKPSWYIWKFLVHVLLNPSLKDFEHYLTSMWNKYNCMVVFTFFGIAVHWDWNENWPFLVLWPLLSFPDLLCWLIECSTFTASSFRIWNSSTGIPSPPLALFVVILSKTHLTSDSRMSGSKWVATPLWFCGLLRPFLYSSSIRLHQPDTFLNPCHGLHHDIPFGLCGFIPYNATLTFFQPEGLPCGSSTLLPASGLTVPFALDAVSPVCMAPF